MIRFRIPPAVVHVICCLAFLALPYVFAPSTFSRLVGLRSNHHERTNLLTYGLMLVFFTSTITC